MTFEGVELRSSLDHIYSLHLRSFTFDNVIRHYKQYTLVYVLLLLNLSRNNLLLCMIPILAAINFWSVVNVYVLNSCPENINHLLLGKQSLKDFSRGKWKAFWQISNHVIKLMISIMVILLFTRKRIYSSMHQYNKTYCSHQTFFRLAPVGMQRQGLS